MRSREAVHPPGGGRMMTKQAERDACDINVIMRRWKVTGVAPVTGASPRYGDFSDGVDYHDALNRCKQADADFADLPADVRSHVNNDPGEFLDMVSDPERVSELEALGLVPKRNPVNLDEREEPEAPAEPAPEPVPA